MNRLSLFILYVMILTPIYSFGMDPSKFPGVTADQDGKTNWHGQDYMVFLHCGAAYGYQLKPIKDATMVDVFFTPPFTQDALPDVTLPEVTFNAIRAMGKELHFIKANCDSTQKDSIASAGRWLSEDAKKQYLKDCTVTSGDIEGALRAVFTKGGGGTSVYEQALAYQALLHKTHKNLLHQVHTTKLKFFGAIACASALLGFFGLYKLCQWWNATPENADTALDEDIAAAQENVLA